MKRKRKSRCSRRSDNGTKARWRRGVARTSGASGFLSGDAQFSAEVGCDKAVHGPPWPRKRLNKLSLGRVASFSPEKISSFLPTAVFPHEFFCRGLALVEKSHDASYQDVANGNGVRGENRRLINFDVSDCSPCQSSPWNSSEKEETEGKQLLRCWKRIESGRNTFALLKQKYLPGVDENLKKSFQSWLRVVGATASTRYLQDDSTSLYSTASSPLPGFAKHMLSSQSRRHVFCFLCIVDTFMLPAELQKHHDILLENEVEVIQKHLIEPVSAGWVDISHISCFEELRVEVERLMCNKTVHHPSLDFTQPMELGMCTYTSQSSWRANSDGLDMASQSALFDYAILSAEVPWIKFSSHVLSMIWEVRRTEKTF